MNTKAHKKRKGNKKNNKSKQQKGHNRNSNNHNNNNAKRMTVKANLASASASMPTHIPGLAKERSGPMTHEEMLQQPGISQILDLEHPDLALPSMYNPAKPCASVRLSVCAECT